MDVLGKVFGGIEVTLLTFGAGALLVAVGAVSEAFLGKMKLKIPEGPVLRSIVGLAGLGLITTAFMVAEPRWKPVFNVERIWSGAGERSAIQVGSDGDDIYVLARNGNVFRIEPSGDEVLVDSGTGTAQIEVAGGVLYVLKDNGNVWSVLLHERAKDLESPAVEPGDIGDEPGLSIPRDDPGTKTSEFGPTFTRIDTGTNTKSIVATGESLYVLKKHSGELYRREVSYVENTVSWERHWVQLHLPQPVCEIATSGSILYYLTNAGRLRVVFPLPEAHSQAAHPVPLEDHVNAALDTCGTASRFAVDGRKVYLRDDHGNAWECVDGLRRSIFRADREESVRELAANGGIVYLLTSNDQIVRYAPGHKTRRFPFRSEGINSLVNLVATAQGAYAIDLNGGVWRFSESLIKQE